MGFRSESLERRHERSLPKKPYKPKVPINLDKICTRFRVEFVNVFSSSDVERVESGSFSGVDRGTGRSLR